MSRKLIELKEKYGVSERSAELINRIDPTNNKKYVEWLFKVRYVKVNNGKYRLNSDFPATKENDVNHALSWFERNLNGKVPSDLRDINKFKSITQFLDTVSGLATPSRSDIKNSVRVVLDNERFKVIVPLTYDSAKMYGRGTKWCTTNKTYYDRYNKEGILYYIIDKSLERKFGFHVPDSAGVTPVLARYNFYNNEDTTINYNTIKLIYGDGFNVVIDTIKKDFTNIIIVKVKKKALVEALKKIEETRKVLNNSGLKDENINKMFDSFIETLDKKNNSFG
jgi:hypothetical protein